MAVATLTPFAPVWNPNWSALPANQAAEGGDAGPVSEPGDSVSLSGLGPRLAQSTLEAAACNQDLSRQRCYHFVKEGLAAEGIELTGKPAYLAANQLARNPHFQEVRVPRDELADLPAGAVVVWNRNVKAGHRNGHISVALGDGREVSDRIRPQVTNYRSQYRVFLPEGATLVARNGDSAASGLPAGGVVG
ncbi:hypothetical protein JST97_09375 [bacterium]|nr:hypothetical protein [bacterium]